MMKKLSLTAAGLLAAVVLLQPQAASARDRDDYRYAAPSYNYGNYGYSYRSSDYERRLRLERERRERERREWERRHHNFNRYYR